MRLFLYRRMALTPAILLIIAQSSAQVRLPQLISDGMVLQRDVPVNVWGWATPAEKIKVEFNGKKYMAVAGPVFRLLAAKDLEVSADYRTARMPPVNVGLLDGELAWRQHDGGHTDALNVKYFLQWADKFIRKIN